MSAPVLDERLPRSKKFVDLTGSKFGRLNVIRFAGFQGKFAKFLCRCSCGNEVAAFASGLKSGSTQSCGCLKAEKMQTHGNSRHPLFAIWSAMRDRCSNPNSGAYKHYGARGIRVCKEWNESFETFVADIGERPSPEHTVGRIDNDLGYEPGNVEWQTRAQQGRNTRHCRYITFDGSTKTLAEWADTLGITREAMRLRMNKKATLEAILTTPKGEVVVDRPVSCVMGHDLADDFPVEWPSEWTLGKVIHAVVEGDPYELVSKLRLAAKGMDYEFTSRVIDQHVMFQFVSYPRITHPTPRS